MTDYADVLMSYEDTPDAVSFWHDLGNDALPERDPLDADQLAALDAHPLHERKWGFGR